MRLRHVALAAASALAVGATAGATHTAQARTGLKLYGGTEYITGLVALSSFRAGAPRLALATTAATAAAILLAERRRPNGAAPGAQRSRWFLSLAVAPTYALVCFGSLCGITGAGMLWDLSPLLATRFVTTADATFGLVESGLFGVALALLWPRVRRWTLNNPGSELVTVGLVWLAGLAGAAAMGAVLVPLLAALPDAELLGIKTR